MIYDCFMFGNELDILEIRLNTLNDIVDKFVLVEARKTHTNLDKELFYENNKERYAEFNHKIIHIVLDDFPKDSSGWEKENLQRNAIAQGLVNCKDDDVIMISDADEIPDPDKILEVKDLPGIKALDMNYFLYSLNNLLVGKNCSKCTKILFYKDYKNILDDWDYNQEFCSSKTNQGTTATKIRCYYGKKQKHFHNSGWHFTFLGTIEDIYTKMLSWPHTYEELDGNKTIYNRAVERFNSNELWGYKILPVTIDESFPVYIYKNQEKFKRLIREASPKNKLSRLSKKSKPKKYLRLPIRIILNFIPHKKLRSAARHNLMEWAGVDYLKEQCSFKKKES